MNALKLANKPGEYAMTLITVLVIVAVVELLAGIGPIVATPLVLDLLFGSAPNALATVVAKVAGVALIAIGAISWSARSVASGPPARAILNGLIIYNLGVVVALLYGFLYHGLSGALLWPVVVLHTLLGLVCVWQSSQQK